MSSPRALLLVTLMIGFVTPAFLATADARNPIRSAFFSTYPGAETTQLDALPSDSKHCGVCHFDFSGGGARNPFGLGVEIGIGNGLSAEQAILDIENVDSDNDGYTNLTEITSVLFSNTPTFPGLSSANVGQISSIPSGEVTPYLTPSAPTDNTPPTVTVSSPNGAESINAATLWNVTYSAGDASGIDRINVYLSDDMGSTYRPVVLGAPDTGTISWFVPNRPGSMNLIKVEAVDNAGNPGDDVSDAAFTIIAQPGLTTFRDMDMSGTQPLAGVVLNHPDDCMTCHADYDAAVEPGFNWAGSMMGNAMRDPLFFAAVVVAEQDAPSVGDLCLRCHTPGGWMEGRSVDTSGGLLTEKDYEGIHCDFCHRLVDINYDAGVDPVEDVDILNAVSPLPLNYANGQFVADPGTAKRGPYSDAVASHQVLESPVHRAAAVCGTCHDVSNPVFNRTGILDYAPGNLDEEHPDMDLRNMFPVERTYSEWTQSDYANGGVYAPQFVGNKPDGMAASCQDCHMRDVTGAGCNVGGSPIRDDLPLHTFAGANTFIPEVLPGMFPGEVDSTALQQVKQDAISMLQLASTLELTATAGGVDVRVINETGHKLPSGYPEGRRIWLHVEAEDNAEATVYESGHYDFATGVLTHDEDAKIYEIKPGLSPTMASITGLPAAPSFHFVLNDTVYSDNRIPPRGFTNANFETIQSPPVAYTYADGQYWDDTSYPLPASAESVTVTLYYQSVSKEYIEFLRDANVTNSAGQDLYDAWVAHGRSAPVVMARETIAVDVTTAVGEDKTFRFALAASRPNPFFSETAISFVLPEDGPAELVVYDVQGRKVRTLHSGKSEAGPYTVSWNGRDEGGAQVASGIYFYRLIQGRHQKSERMVLLR